MSIKPSKIEKLKRKPYRDEYLREMVKGWIVHQIKAIRQERGLTQSDLAEATGTTQSVVARNEDPDYGKWNISTLLDYANAYDVALEVKFVDWATFLSDMDDTSPEAMAVSSFEQTVDRLSATSDLNSSTIITAFSDRSYRPPEADLVYVSSLGTINAIEFKNIPTSGSFLCRSFRWIAEGPTEIPDYGETDTGTTTTGGSDPERYIHPEREIVQ